jgi:hypothetical protein
VRWVHALHQVTGTFAVCGDRMTDADRDHVLTIMRNVTAEMADDSNWRST